jgi:hypothetical protein
MIRRGFWLAAGAVLGVAGYRRATRLVDGLTRTVTVGQPRPDRQGRAGADNQVAPFGRGGAVSRQESAHRKATTAARIGSAVGFAQDVRDGVAEYLELHHRELARNLGDRSDRTSSG